MNRVHNVHDQGGDRPRRDRDSARCFRWVLDQGTGRHRPGALRGQPDDRLVGRRTLDLWPPGGKGRSQGFGSGVERRGWRRWHLRPPATGLPDGCRLLRGNLAPHQEMLSSERPVQKQCHVCACPRALRRTGRHRGATGRAQAMLSQYYPRIKRLACGHTPTSWRQQRGQAQGDLVNMVFLATPETDAPSRHAASTMRLLSAALKLRHLPGPPDRAAGM
jgi:hypothetical protein